MARRPAQHGVRCDDFTRVYDDGEVHRVDLEGAGPSPWDKDTNPLTYSTAPVPGAQLLGDGVSRGAERNQSVTARQLAGYRNSAHVAFFDVIEEAKAVESADISILGPRVKQTLHKFRYAFDVTRPVPFISRGKLDMTLEVKELYLDLLQTFANIRLPGANRMLTSAEFTDAKAADVFLHPQRLLSCIYNHFCFLTRFWKRMLADIRTGVLDRGVTIPPQHRRAVQAVLFPQPERAKFLDGVLQQLGFHTRESIMNRVGIRKQAGGAAFRQDPARDKYLRRLRAGEARRHEEMMANQSTKLEQLFEWWRRRSEDEAAGGRAPMTALLRVRDGQEQVDWAPVEPPKFAEDGTLAAGATPLQKHVKPMRDVATPVHRRRFEPLRVTTPALRASARSVLASTTGRRFSGGPRTPLWRSPVRENAADGDDGSSGSEGDDASGRAGSMVNPVRTPAPRKRRGSQSSVSKAATRAATRRVSRASSRASRGSRASSRATLPPRGMRSQARSRRGYSRASSAVSSSRGSVHGSDAGADDEPVVFGPQNKFGKSLHGTVMDMDALPGMLRRVNVTDDTRPYTAPYNSRHLEQPGSTGYQRLYWPGRAKNTVEFFSPAEGAFGCREPTCTWRFETAAEMKAHFKRHHKADWDADARAKVALDRINAAKNLDKDKFAAVVLEVMAALDTMAKERVIAAQGGDVNTGPGDGEAC